MIMHQIDGGVHAYHHGDLRRCLVDAALALVAEGQNWTFSLREVARRAGVSHNAPYHHFADKRDLLTAVAAVGFAAVRKRMLAANAKAKNVQTALAMCAIEYVKFGIENPAHYRLMFGSGLVTERDDLPDTVRFASRDAQAVFKDIVYRGAHEGIFAVSSENKKGVHIAALSAWSAVHGLTLLAIESRTGSPPLRIERIVKTLTRTFLYGLIRR